jgi:methenyltetrahydromethanopterin cyclohydrolase
MQHQSLLPTNVLIIAQSGRMLAQLAVDAGFTPWVIDCFADLDTQSLAQQSFKVNSLALSDIKNLTDQLKEDFGLTHLLYGSGFENYTDSLAYLEKHWVVLGNPVEVICGLQDKPKFFQRLQALNIPFPESRFEPPDVDDSWLLKHMQGQGGTGVYCSQKNHNAAFAAPPHKIYWQRQLAGVSMSVSFLAGSDALHILGFNRQWTQQIGPNPFVFAGVTNHADISSANQAVLYESLAKLVKLYAVRGLGSLDFMLVDGRCYVLEINARIPASAQLYGKSVLNAHIQACLGLASRFDVQIARPAGFWVCYASAQHKLPQAACWPDWVLDRPEPAAIIGKGQPICSIIASGNSPAQVLTQLQTRQSYIETILN